MPNLFKSPTGVAAKVEALIKPTIEALNLRLWDVRYEKEGGEWFLRVFIDRDEPMDTDTCELASRAIDPILDEADPIEQSYYLEVGSPGLGRSLTREWHFEQCIQQPMLLKLYAPDEHGNKEYSGNLLSFTASGVTVENENGIFTISAQKIAHVKLLDDKNLI